MLFLSSGANIVFAFTFQTKATIKHTHRQVVIIMFPNITAKN